MAPTPPHRAMASWRGCCQWSKPGVKINVFGALSALPSAPRSVNTSNASPSRWKQTVFKLQYYWTAPRLSKARGARRSAANVVAQTRGDAHRSVYLSEMRLYDPRMNLALIIGASWYFVVSTHFESRQWFDPEALLFLPYFSSPQDDAVSKHWKNQIFIFRAGYTIRISPVLQRGRKKYIMYLFLLIYKGTSMIHNSMSHH